MAYTGIVLPIPMGQGGLRTDDSPNVIDPTDLIDATNVNFHSNLVSKEGGSARLNTSAITGGVIAAYDWWPTSAIADRRTIAVGGNGRTYSISNAGAVTEITGAVATLVTTNQFYFLACGQESTTQPRTLFIFNGLDPIQVISGTGGTRASLATPNVDWGASNQPRAAFLHRGAVYAFGVPSAPHTVYRSSLTDHEDFNTASPTTLRYTVYQGEGESLIASMIFRGKPYVYKTPAGFYALNDSEVDPANWYFQRVSSILGAASPNSVVEALNDVVVKTPTDNLLSVAATQQFGDVTASDVLEIMNIAQYIRDNTTPNGAVATFGLYYSEKKTMYFTYRSPQATANDRILAVRTETTGKPKASWLTKDAALCMALRKDTTGIARPIYGAADGYVYVMDQGDFNVNGVAYNAQFQTPHLDMGFMDARVAGQLVAKRKSYDFLEMRLVPLGNYSIYVDVYIDRNFHETIEFPLVAGDLLAFPASDTDLDFMLSDTATDPDGSILAGDDFTIVRRRLSGCGRTISFVVRSSGLNEGFKIATMIVGFRPSNEFVRNSTGV